LAAFAVESATEARIGLAGVATTGFDGDVFIRAVMSQKQRIKIASLARSRREQNRALAACFAL
jgi:hypothetical protein